MKTFVPVQKQMTAGAVICDVPLLGIEPGPTEPESVILSFKLQRQWDCKDRKIFWKPGPILIYLQILTAKHAGYEPVYP